MSKAPKTPTDQFPALTDPTAFPGFLRKLHGSLDVKASRASETDPEAAGKWFSLALLINRTADEAEAAIEPEEPTSHDS